MSTREEIMQLNVGRETDLLVAEQVMGWQLETDEAELRKLSRYFSRDKARRWWRNPEGGWHCDPPGFSSDIKDGWKVVERMQANGKSLYLSPNFNGNRVAFDQPDVAEADYIVEKNLLLAICKAALLAIK
jgi:Phage ABA sandwich domain